MSGACRGRSAVVGSQAGAEVLRAPSPLSGSVSPRVVWGVLAAGRRRQTVAKCSAAAAEAADAARHPPGATRTDGRTVQCR